MTTVSRRKALSVLAGAGAVLSGCGGGDTGAAAPAPVPAPGPSPAPAPAPTAFFDPVYGTRFTDSSMTTVWPQIYIDPFNGRDGADGTTRATAVRTKAGLLAHPLLGPPGLPGEAAGRSAIVRGLTIGIVGHPTAKVREQFDFFNAGPSNGYRRMELCSWVRVGFDPVQGDCTDVASPGAFTPRSGGYAINWRHDFHEVALCRFRVFINGRPLRRVGLESEVSPGRYWYAGVPEEGAAKTIVFADFDGADPRSSGRLVEITARDVFISGRGGLIEGIFAERNGHNSGSFVLARDIGQTGDPSALRASLVYEGTKHNAVFGHGEHFDLIAVNCRDNDFDPNGEVPILLTLAQREFVSDTATLTRCLALGDTSLWGPGVPVGQNSAHAFLTHDSSADGGLTSLTLTDCGAINLAAGWNCGLSRQSTIKGHYSPLLTSTTGASSHIAGADAFPIAISRSLLGGSDSLYRWVDNRSVRVTSSALLCFGSFSGGGITTLGRSGSVTVEDTFLIADQNVSPPFIDVASGSLSNQRNVEIGALNVFVAGSAVTISSDSNLHKPFVGGIHYCNVNNAAFTLAAWKAASGKDANTQAVETASDAGFASGVFPSPFVPDLNLTPGGKAATTMQNPLTPAEVTAMRGRPATLAQARAYLLNSAPSRRAVRE